MFVRELVASVQKLGYNVVYGDSVTEDTAVFIKDKNGNIEIIPIIETAPYKVGRHRSEKKVWTRDGWSNIDYIKVAPLRKQIYRVSTTSGTVEVTEDHSLFDDRGNEVKPTDKFERVETKEFPLIANESYVDPDIASILGLIASEGSLIGNNRQPVINCDEQTLREIQKLFTRLGYKSYLHDYTISHRCWRLNL